MRKGRVNGGIIGFVIVVSQHDVGHCATADGCCMADDADDDAFALGI